MRGMIATHDAAIMELYVVQNVLIVLSKYKEYEDIFVCLQGDM